MGGAAEKGGVRRAPKGEQSRVATEWLIRDKCRLRGGRLLLQQELRDNGITALMPIRLVLFLLFELFWGPS